MRQGLDRVLTEVDDDKHFLMLSFKRGQPPNAVLVCTHDPYDDTRGCRYNDERAEPTACSVYDDWMVLGWDMFDPDEGTSVIVPMLPIKYTATEMVSNPPFVERLVTLK